VKRLESTNALLECPRFEGQVIVMSGEVTYIRIVPAGEIIELDNHPICSFSSRHKARIAELRKGDHVVVKGLVEKTTLEAHLSSCILLGREDMAK
jgi:hypothetical protein